MATKPHSATREKSQVASRQPDVAEADRAADEGARQDAHPSLLKTHHNVFSLLLERVHNIPAT